MSKVLVIFGSKSDDKVYSEITKILKENKIDFDLHVRSAHRTPEEVDQIVNDDYSLVIAGAGLSAALPGVVASKTIRPVIGVPCKGNYEGLDALLSIAQMPPGVPVLAVGVEKADIAANNSVNALNVLEKVRLIVDDEGHKAVKKAKEMLDKFKVKYEVADKIDKDSINIEFVYFDEPVEKKDELVIYCPLVSEEDDKAEAAINLLKHSDHGLWVGLNRGDNAGIAAIEILSINGKYDKQLKEYKEEMRKKVLTK